jgi:hypothetical protein
MEHDEHCLVPENHISASKLPMKECACVIVCRPLATGRLLVHSAGLNCVKLVRVVISSELIKMKSAFPSALVTLECNKSWFCRVGCTAKQFPFI